MKNVLIQAIDNNLVFSNYLKPLLTENLNQTNIIKNDELVFGLEYIRDNQKIFASFLNGLITEFSINTFVFETYEIATALSPILADIKSLAEIYFVEKTSIPYLLCEELVECKNLTKIHCYTAPAYIIQLLDRNGILIEMQSEVLFTSKFMAINNLNNYSKIYYKTTVRIEDAFEQNDFQDFKTFCKINTYLKTINFYLADINLLREIISILNEFRMKDIIININANITDKRVIDELKRINHECESKYEISLKLVYSDDYISKNLFPQVIVNIAKTSFIVIILIAITVYCTVLYKNHLSYLNAQKINNSLKEVMAETPADPEETKPENVGNVIRKKYSALMAVNEETVGWLKVNNTEIDYPVVRAQDNDFYLSKDFNKSPEANGWVFMDYRNSVQNMGRNTIIYGHNNYSSLMFGTLNQTAKKDWYTNEENLIISFDTLYKDYNWKIFSIYRIQKTNDYISTYFPTDEAFMSFINTVKKRSIHNFETSLNVSSKILTLSTCIDNNNRFVVHAVLLDS